MKTTNKRKVSPIWSISTNEFATIVINSNSFSDILKKFDYPHNAIGNYRTLMKRIDKEGIDVSHIRGKKNFQNGVVRNLDDILVENSNYQNRGSLKRRLLKEGLLENKCYSCDLPPIWNGKVLSLQLEHKNGKNNDNRIQNLELLCPNCHSQTDTFAGRNATSTIIKKVITCSSCTTPITKNTKYNLCTSCYAKTNRKIIRPSKEKLYDLIVSMPFTKIGEMFGVSDNAVRKWCKSYKLPYRIKDLKEYIQQN